MLILSLHLYLCMNMVKASMKMKQKPSCTIERLQKMGMKTPSETATCLNRGKKKSEGMSPRVELD